MTICAEDITDMRCVFVTSVFFCNAHFSILDGSVFVLMHLLINVQWLFAVGAISAKLMLTSFAAKHIESRVSVIFYF